MKLADEHRCKNIHLLVHPFVTKSAYIYIPKIQYCQFEILQIIEEILILIKLIIDAEEKHGNSIAYKRSLSNLYNFSKTCRQSKYIIEL